MVEPIQPAKRVEPVETSPTPNPAPPRKRRRWLGWIIALAVLLVLLVVGFFVADAFAKQYATAYVRDRIIEVLKLDPKSEVDVDLGSGSVILQALSGGLDEVNVHANEITFGDISGDAQITATKVPLDGAQPLDTLDITVTIAEDDVKKLATSLSGVELKTIELVDKVVRVGADLTVVVVTIPVSIDLKPGAVNGAISFTPEVVQLGGQEISITELKKNPLVSSLAGRLLDTQTVCVAQYLPQALTITSVDVVGKTLVVGINGDGTALGGSDLSTLGVCPK